jgi:periplasmic protein CpxP/Spy
LVESIVTLARCGSRTKTHKIAAWKSNIPPQQITPKPTMKKNLAQLLPLLAIAIATPAFAANNYFNSNAPQTQQIAYGENGKYTNNLNLTPEQKAKMEQLRAATRAKMDAVLTPEQRQKLTQLKSQRQANKQDRQRTSLTTDQKAKIQAIRQASKEQFKAILTPAQQAQLGNGERGWGNRGSMAQLNLTPEQKTKMQELRAASRRQMNEVLTPEQQQAAKTRSENRQAMRKTWQSLDLTADQKAKIQAIRQERKQQLNAILTPEQQTKLKSHRHGHRHYAGNSI